MKSYREFINEGVTNSVRDLMTPKSEEDIMKKIIKKGKSVRKNFSVVNDKLNKLIKNGYKPIDALMLIFNRWYSYGDLKSYLSSEQQKELYDFYKKDYDIIFLILDQDCIDSKEKLLNLMKSDGYSVFNLSQRDEDFEFEFIFIKPPITNESIRDLMTPKSKEDIQGLMIDKLKKINHPITEYSGVEFKHISELMGGPMKNLHIINNTDNGFDIIHSYFSSLVKRSKCIEFDWVDGKLLSNGDVYVVYYSEERLALRKNEETEFKSWVFDKLFYTNVTTNQE